MKHYKVCGMSMTPKEMRRCYIEITKDKKADNLSDEEIYKKLLEVV